MNSLEIPPSADGIYDSRGDIDLTRPVTQGDVFRDVRIPGFDNPFPAVIITQHPCSMRRGAILRERLTVAGVRIRQAIREGDWAGNASAMLLPGLLNNATDYYSDFRDSGSVKTVELKRESRIAALTNYGVQVLHQRSIYYHTRLIVDMKTLAETYDPIATELELQYDWVDNALQSKRDVTLSDDTLEAISEAEKDFGEYLDANERALRNGLQDAVTRADIRRQVRREIMRRYQQY